MDTQLLLQQLELFLLVFVRNQGRNCAGRQVGVLLQGLLLDSLLQLGKSVFQCLVALIELLDVVDRLEEDGALGVVDVLERRDDFSQLLEPAADCVASLLLRCNVVCTLLVVGKKLSVLLVELFIIFHHFLIRPLGLDIPMTQQAGG